MTEPDTGPEWRWDVALSFAGAQRDYAEQVAQALQARGVRCFYDADEQIELWGKYLAEELPAIYAEQAAAVVVFVSAEYAARDWTRLERRAALGRAVRERREYVLPARFDDTPLPGLLSDMVAIDLRTRDPQQFAAMIAAKLATLGITVAGRAGSPVQGAGEARPPGAVRVEEADLRRLGVHAAISVPGVADEVPPEYVPRDADTAGHGVRDRVAAAAARGGFVLLVGGSSVGKTRCAAEAVRALLPDWWLVHPDGPGQVAALAAAPHARTVVWLDELQRYLDGGHRLTGGVVRALLSAPGRVVIIGTVWPDRYAAYTALPSGGADPHAREREVLDLADVVRIDPEFSSAEHDRARAAATRDRRLAVALGAAGYGLTQTLAAAPQLVARWENAKTIDPYAWAVLTAALDAARLGARAPLTAEFLRAAAPGYCTPQQQAEAPAIWFEQALAYATAKQLGAAAALAPEGAVMGQVAGYTAADYLIQHASRERRTARVPASTWDATISDIRDLRDAARLADSAAGRLLYCYALPLYRHVSDANPGNMTTDMRLTDLLTKRGDLDELRARAHAGNTFAAMRLAERGDLDELRARADAGDLMATVGLAGLLMERGGEDELSALADAGDVVVIDLATVPGKDEDLDELHSRADDLDELRSRAHAGNTFAAMELAERGELDEAIQILRVRADAGDRAAAMGLAALLAERGDLDELRSRAHAGNTFAAMWLAERGELDEAIQILFALAVAGHGDAERLAELLDRQGRGDEAERLRQFGLNPNGSVARELSEKTAQFLG